MSGTPASSPDQRVEGSNERISTPTRLELLGTGIAVFLRGADRAIHSKRGVWVVLVALVGVTAIATIGFRFCGWSSQYIPLYAADAEMGAVAAAIYVILVRWDDRSTPRE